MMRVHSRLSQDSGGGVDRGENKLRTPARQDATVVLPEESTR